MQLQIPVVNQTRCKEAFKTFRTAHIDDRVLCAGYAAGGKDACQVCVTTVRSKCTRMCHCHWASRGLYASIFRVNYKDCFTLKMKALWSFAMSATTCPTTTKCHFSVNSAARASLQLEVTQKLNVKNMGHTNLLLIFTMLYDHIFTGWLWRTAYVVQGQPFLPDRYCIIWISVCRARLSRRLYQGHSLPGLDHISPYIRLQRCSVENAKKFCKSCSQISADECLALSHGTTRCPLE